VSGPIHFDSDGILNRTSIDIRHLVKKGRKMSWHRIGYVKGDDVTPFGILWPFEPVKSHIINGKKLLGQPEAICVLFDDVKIGVLSRQKMKPPPNADQNSTVVKVHKDVIQRKPV